MIYLPAVSKIKSPKLSGFIGIHTGERIALIGSGGKTSLMYLLAEENRGACVLIGTTTLILRPEPHQYDREINCDSDIAKTVSSSPKKGITLAYGGELRGKLLPLSSLDFARLNHAFDYTILECDGSKQLPLKGWAEREPVIGDFTTLTIGVCTLWPIGQPISEKNTLRLQKFCEITGANPGDIVTESHIAAMLSHPLGMMGKAVGKKALIINQVESEDAMQSARKLLSILPESFLQSLSLVLAGSVKYNDFETLWRCQNE